MYGFELHAWTTLKGKIGNRDGFERRLRAAVGTALGQAVAAALAVPFRVLDGHEICRVEIPTGPEAACVSVTDRGGQKREALYVRMGNRAEDISSGRDRLKYVRSRRA